MSNKKKELSLITRHTPVARHKSISYSNYIYLMGASRKISYL